MEDISGVLLILFTYYIIARGACELVRSTPDLLKVLGLLLAMALEGIGMLLKFLLIALARCCRWAGRRARDVIVFLYFLGAEALRGNAGQATGNDEWAWGEGWRAEQDHEDRDDYQRALELLGLQADCTLEMLNRAFRKVMETAHPDKGGTHDRALAANAARNLIKTRNGWR